MQVDLAFLADALPVCIAYVDAGQRYRFSNKSFEQWLGCSRQSLFGRHVAEVLGAPAYELMQKQIEAALAGETVRFEGIVPLQGLGERQLRVDLVPDHRGYGSVRGFFSVVTDMSEASRSEVDLSQRLRGMQALNRQLREVQGPLIEAERLGAASDLAISIAQAINNPLTALIGTLEMALEAPRRARLKPERILHLAHRIKNVVGEMLHSFRQDHFNLEATDPAELLSDVRDALASRAAAQAVTLRLKVQTALHHLLVDRKLLRRALVNIGENGLDEMRDGGTLTLEVGDVPGLELLEFRVSDTGPGIPHELRKRVLESFFTTKEDSRGLGLSIAHGVVRGHEGRIRIEDRPGGGTLVAVELPRLPAHTGVTEDR